VIAAPWIDLQDQGTIAEFAFSRISKSGEYSRSRVVRGKRSLSWAGDCKAAFKSLSDFAEGSIPDGNLVTTFYENHRHRFNHQTGA